MADKSAIEWTDATWTPIRARAWEIQDDGSGKERIGWHCEHISDGCRNCYAEIFNLRLGTGFEFKPGNLRGEPGYSGGGIDRPEVFLDEKMLLAPMRWKKPRMIFVCSMTDAFADFVKDEWLDRMFAIMALCPQHTFQVLTKRAERMRAYCSQLGHHHSVDRVSLAMKQYHPESPGAFYTLGNGGWHFKNIWLGVSAERQKEAEERIPHLLATPAAVRFISAEPLLGPIDLMEVIPNPIIYNAIHGMERLLDWVIVGGDSGGNARPMHPSWARALRDQCAATGVPFFFKQWGEWAAHKPVAGDDLGGDVRRGVCRVVHPTGQSDVEVFEATGGRNTIPGTRYVKRVGKKAAGRLLDGVTHDGFPEVRT